MLGAAVTGIVNQDASLLQAEMSGGGRAAVFGSAFWLAVRAIDRWGGAAKPEKRFRFKWVVTDMTEDGWQSLFHDLLLIRLICSDLFLSGSI